MAGQTAAVTAMGLVFLVVGCMIYAVGRAVSKEKTRNKAERRFWPVNIWALVFIPLSLLHNGLAGRLIAAPCPLLVGSIARYFPFWLVYIGGCMAFCLVWHRRKSKIAGACLRFLTLFWGIMAYYAKSFCKKNKTVI